MGGCASRPKDNVEESKIPEELPIETTTPSKLIANVIEVTTAIEATTESSENLMKENNEAPTVDLIEPKPTEATTNVRELKIDAVEVSESKTNTTQINESKSDVTEVSESKINTTEISESKTDTTKMSELKINAKEVSESKVDTIEKNLNIGGDDTSAKEEVLESGKSHGSNKY